MGRTESEERMSNSKIEKDWVKARKVGLKNGKDWLNKWEGPSQKRRGLIQKHGRSESKKEGLVDTSQLSITFFSITK